MLQKQSKYPPRSTLTLLRQAEYFSKLFTPRTLRWAPFFLFIGIGIFLFQELVFHGNAFMGGEDRIRHEIPLMQLAAKSISKGQLPQWNSFLFSGCRLMGDMGLRLLNPFNLIILRLFPSHIALAASWRILIETILLMIFAYLLFNAVWKDRLLAIFSALAYSLSNGMIEQINHGHLLGSYIYFPLALLVLLNWKERATAINILYLSPIFALQLAAGFHQYNAYLFIFSGIFAFSKCLKNNSFQFPILKKLILILGASTVLAVMLNAIEMLPFLEAQKTSNRGAVDYLSFLDGMGMPGFMALRILLPHFLGDNTNFPSFLGRDLFPLEIFTAYAGIATFFFCTVTLAFPLRSKIWPWLVSILFIALCSLKTPFLRIPYLLFMKAPLAHGRMSALIPICMAFLAPQGIQLFLNGGKKFQLRCLAILTVAAMAVFTIAYGIFPSVSLSSMLPTQAFEVAPTTPSMTERYQKAALLFITGAGALLILMGLYFFQRLRESSFKLACVVLLALDLLFFARIYTLRKIFPPENKWYPPSPVVEFLQSLPDKEEYHFNIQTGVSWANMPNRDRFHFNVNIPYGLHDINGYLNFSNRRYGELLTQGTDPNFMRVMLLHSINTPQMADLFAVKYFVMSNNKIANEVYAPFSEIIFSTNKILVLEKRKPLKRWHLACQAAVSDTLGDTLSLAHLPQVDLSQAVFVESKDTFKYDWSICRKSNLWQFFMKEVNSGHLEGVALTDQPALLVITETYDPGWQAFVNGHPAVIHRANYAFQMIELPQGRSQIDLIYKSPQLKKGLTCCLIAIGVLFYLSRRAFRNRRKRSLAHSPNHNQKKL